MASHHSSFRCYKCPQRFNNKKKLTKHMLKKHGTTTYPCVKCERIFTRMDFLSKHILDVHYVINVIIKENNKDEVKLMDANRPYMCDSCETSFKTKSHRRRHSVTVHATTIISCDECKKQFSRRDILNEHKKRKHEALKFKCLKPNE